MENHAKESIKHKVVLPNSKTINIEGTKFKYEIHYDQLDDKDLLRIEKYANHIFHAYQEKYGLDMNTDHTFKGFTYSNLTDLRHGVYANAYGHHYYYKSESIAHNLTQMIYFTLNFYNEKYQGYPGSTFIKDVEKELKAIRLDDNQEEPKKIEPSGSEAISTETILPNSKTINIEGTKFKYEIHYDQLDDKDLLRIEKYANHIFHAYQEKYGLDINTDHTFRGFIYNNLADLRNAHPEYGIAHSHADFHYYPHESECIVHDLTAMIDFTLNLYNQEKRGIPYPEDANTFIRDVAEELEKIGLDDNQEESSTEERSKTTINQEKELEEQDVITTTDHPLDDYNHDYHLIG